MVDVTVDTMADDVRATIKAFKKKLIEMNAKLNTIILVVRNQPVMDYMTVKVLDRMKIVNSKTMPTLGLSRGVPLKLGHWKGKTEFVVVLMDDFDVILGMKFLSEKKAIPTTNTHNLLIMVEKSCVVQIKIKQPSELRIFSALQFKKGVKHQEPTYVVVPLHSLVVRL